MRHLKSAAGFTLIELMVALARAAGQRELQARVLQVQAVLWCNLHLSSDDADPVRAEALFAQSEALKRNGPVRMQVSATSVKVIDIGVQPEATLRERSLGGDIVADVATVDFGSTGTPLPFGTDAAINVNKSGVTCSADLRCPGLRVDGGGGIRLCGNRLSCL